jgi:NAD(P)-dependent dehydrogenase (short-subunit alcohol dehydrogenase family)
VTGAGRGIGRAYALLLAERGASIVVNDLGGSTDGVGTDPGPASSVAAEITEAGGIAVSDAADVSTTTGAHAVVDHTIDEFGRIDILINNAGVIRFARWGKGSTAEGESNLDVHLSVHLGGSVKTTRAAWPHMVERSYGRIVMTTSSGIFGLSNNTAYATAKAAVIGLTRSIALAGAEHGIKVNLIAPAAMTRMAGPAPANAATQMAPELVSPMAAFLSHQDCPVSGEIYTAGGGRFARLFIGSTEGYVHEGRPPAIEDIAENWSRINDESGYYVPADLMDWSQKFMSHLPRPDHEEADT